MEQSETVKRVLYKEYAQGVYDGNLSAFEALDEVLGEIDFDGLTAEDVVTGILYAVQANINFVEKTGPIPWEDYHNAVGL